MFSLSPNGSECLKVKDKEPQFISEIETNNKGDNPEDKTDYITPCACIAPATLRKPAIFAPIR